MKLSKCIMGILVIDKDENIGHVVGLTASTPCYPVDKRGVIPLIKWACKEIPHAIHHGNIEIYKD